MFVPALLEATHDANCDIRQVGVGDQCAFIATARVLPCYVHST